MESLGDLLGQKNMDEPTELTSLREFIKKEYGYEPTIKVAPNMITVYMPNAAEASTLRMSYRDIQRYCKLTRKLYIRIG